MNFGVDGVADSQSCFSTQANGHVMCSSTTRSLDRMKNAFRDCAHSDAPSVCSHSSMAKTLRAPKLDLTTVLTSQNPHIDLRLEPYEVSTRNFLRAVSNYTQRAITEISNRKTVHVSSRKKFLERLQQIEAETNQCKMKEIELIKGAAPRFSLHVLLNIELFARFKSSVENRRKREMPNLQWRLLSGSYLLSRRSALCWMRRLTNIGSWPLTWIEVRRSNLLTPSVRFYGLFRRTEQRAVVA